MVFNIIQQFFNHYVYFHSSEMNKTESLARASGEPTQDNNGIPDCDIEFIDVHGDQPPQLSGDSKSFIINDELSELDDPIMHVRADDGPKSIIKDLAEDNGQKEANKLTNLLQKLLSNVDRAEENVKIEAKESSKPAVDKQLSIALSKNEKMTLKIQQYRKTIKFLRLKLRREQNVS